MNRKDFRILVLDDEPDWRRANEKTLARAGFAVRTASTGAEALKMLAAEKFQMAVLDINLPDCDGAELAGKVRRLSPATVVIMLTGFATIEKASVAAAGGSSDILEKIADDPDDKPLSEELVERAEEISASVAGGG